MPFTPSHAVVALPFLRTPLVPAAIAIGAMTPDLPLFLRGTGLRYSFTHAPGNVLWTAAIALGLFLLWRAVLRPAVPELVPRAVRERLPEEWRMPASAALRQALGVGEPRSYPVMLTLSLVIGVATHIVWDAFTHAGRWGVAAVPALGERWGPLLGYKWLQHGSSAIGLLIIGVWAVLWLRRRRPMAPSSPLLPSWVRVAWWLALPVLLVVALIAGYAASGPFSAAFTPQHLAYRVLPPACAIWGAIGLGLCLVVLLRWRTPPSV